MAIREELILDLSQALSQLDDLERSLDSLIQPITIPVKVDDDAGLERLARDADRAEDEFEDLRQEVDRTDTGLEKVERQAKKTGDDLERAGKKGEKSFKGMTKGILAFGAALGGIAALRAVGGFFADSIQAASDLEESVGKATVVFGEFFGEIEEFTSTAPQALGLSTAAALEMTGTFGNLFVALGLSQEAAAGLAPDIVQLGADLASFNNLEVTDALDKLRAGLVGEAEPLRALGVNLTAATTAAKAMELGLVDANGVVTEAGKVQARYALILEQTQTSQGDFARTADGLANRQRTLNGLWENAKVAIGEALVPAFEELLDIAPGLIASLEDMAPLVGALAEIAAAAIPVITDLVNIFGVWTGTLDVAAVALRNWEKSRGFEATTTRDITAAILEEADARRNWVDAVLFGIGPLEAGTDALVAWIEASELTGPELEALREEFERLGAEGELTTWNILDLADAIDRQLADQMTRGADAALLLRGGIEATGEAAAEAAPEVDEFTDAMKKLRQAKVDDIIAELETQFDALPDALNAAAAALRDTEGDIVEDFTDFLDNLDAELEARAEFATNILILRALGLDDLATVFEQAGLDAAAALADAIANPDEAREAERKLVGFAEDQADAFNRAFLAKIQELGLAGMFTIPVSVTLDTVTITPPNLAGIGPGASGGDIFDIKQFFDNTPGPNTETERAAQQISTIIRS